MVMPHEGIKKKMSNLSIAKQASGYAAAQYVQDGMIVGLGTGSTAEHFIHALIDRCKNGLRITGVATSKRSRDLALQANIPMLPDDAITSIDLTVDGADEITLKKQMIKGGGGALLREKIVAAASKEIIIVVDETKVVKELGAFPLAVEILPFAYLSTLAHLKTLGYVGAQRFTDKQKPYVTDNGNYIIDLHFRGPIDNPKQEHQSLCSIPGVMETGLFFDLPVKIIIGFPDGQTELIG